MKYTKVALMFWNWTYFGNIPTRISFLKKYIANLQFLPQINSTLELEELICKELEEIQLREKLHWSEKAKIQFLIEGDANTHFFHNHIHNIFDESNNWITYPNLISVAFAQLYTNLFSREEHSFPIDLQDPITNSIERDANDKLIVVPDPTEIYLAINSMQGFKVPDQTKWPQSSIETFWSTIGKDVMTTTQSFFQKEIISRAVNYNFFWLWYPRDKQPTKWINSGQ